MPTTRRALLLAWAAVLLIGGCSSSGSRGSWIIDPGTSLGSAPEADSPAGLLRLFQWCHAHRDTTQYRTLFSDDFRFVFGAGDPGGNSGPWTRQDELAYFDHLVNGGNGQPAAQSIVLLMDRNFVVKDDPSMPGRAHKLVRTSLSLQVVTGVNWQIVGFANFFMVRGDSTAIPADLVARGFAPDSTRWYIRRWEDDTLMDPGLRAMPLQKVTWGSLKIAYR